MSELPDNIPACDGAYREFLSTRRAELIQRVDAACARVGRSSAEICLEAISKTVDAPALAQAAACGYSAFGENRPQELVRKRAALAEMGLDELANLRIDMIGNLQTNKINQVLGRTTLIQSVSSQHLFEAIRTRAEVRGVTGLAVLLECNILGESSKSGFAPAELREVFGQLLAQQTLHIEGLMGMAPAHKPDDARRSFAGLRELRDRLEGDYGVSLPTLSCGMSDDFEIAVEEGSTLLRLGRVVFDASYTLA